MELLTDPLSTGIAQRALAELCLLALLCGPLGVWVLALRHAYTAESIAHGMLPGLVVAALTGAPLLLGAGAGLLLAAVVIALAARDARVGPDAGVAVTVTTLVGLGALLALSPDAPARLSELLFGDLLAVSGGDLAASAALVAAGLAALGRLHRPLALVSFDRATASGLGAGAGRVELALLALLAAWTLAAVGALGNLLVVALLVAPAAAAGRLTDRLVPALALAAALAAAAAVGGLYLSYHLDLAGGASVALVAVGLFGASLAFGGRAATSPRSPVRAVGGAR